MYIYLTTTQHVVQESNIWLYVWPNQIEITLMIDNCHLVSLEVLEGSIIDFTWAYLLVVAIHFVLIDNNEAFFVFIFIE